MTSFRNLSIGQKIITAILSVNILGIGLMAAVLHDRSSAIQTETAMESVHNLAEKHAETIRSQLESVMSVARTMAQVMEQFDNLEPEERRADYEVMIKGVVEANPNFFGIYTIWEPEALDGRDAEFVGKEGYDSSGRANIYYYRDETNKVVRDQEPAETYLNPGEGDYYQIPLKTGVEAIVDPYEETYAGNKILMTSLAVPIKKDGKVLGVVGIDIALTSMQKLVEGIKPYGTGQAAIFSNSGVVVAHADPSRLGKDMRESEKDLGAELVDQFADSVAGGKVFSFETDTQNLGADMKFISIPFTTGKSTTPWSMVVGVPLDKVLEPVSTLLNFTVIIGFSVIALVSVALVLVTRAMVRPIRRAVEMLKDISEGEGDLTARLTVHSGDEMGEMAGYFNSFIEKLQAMIASISTNAVAVASSATEMSAVSDHSAQSVRQLSSKTAAVASAAEEMSSNTSSVAAGMEETSSSLASVASATEEMTSTIGEISSNTERARSTTESAASQVDSFASVLQELGVAAKEIGKVTEDITGISSQTNLLALNATIEAARAGDAGRGFAVVANEIKELAQKTAGATEDIRARITGIQNATGSAVSDIDKIVRVIREVNDIVSTIAAAIEEQSAVTREVAGNIAQASQGVQDANTRSAEMSVVSGEIARDIGLVDSITGEIRSGGEKVQASAQTLANLAAELKGLVGRFKIKD